MYSDWTRNILEAYRQHEKELKQNVKEYIKTSELAPLEDDLLSKLCRYWWIGLCAIGISGILHPNNQEEINPECIDIMAKEAHLDKKITSVVVMFEDTLIKNYNETDEINGISMYIMPIPAVYNMLTNNPDDFHCAIPNEEVFMNIGGIGIEALKAGETAWRKVVYGKLREFDKYFQNKYSKKNIGY